MVFHLIHWGQMYNTCTQEFVPSYSQRGNDHVVLQWTRFRHCLLLAVYLDAASPALNSHLVHCVWPRCGRRMLSGKKQSASATIYLCCWWICAILKNMFDIFMLLLVHLVIYFFSVLFYFAVRKHYPLMTSDRQHVSEAFSVRFSWNTSSQSLFFFLRAN